MHSKQIIRGGFNERRKIKVLVSRRKYKDYHKEINRVLYKRCIDCNEWIIADLEHFGRDRNTKSKFNDRCKSCQKAYNDAYYAKTREHQIEKAKINQKANRDRHLIALRKNNARPEVKLAMKLSDKSSRERGLRRKWRQEHPEKCRWYASLHRNHDITKTEEESLLKVFNYQCAYCGMTLEEHKKKFKQKLHNDHVDEDGYNDLRNDVPACVSCNCGKHESELEDWYFKQKFFSEDKYNKIVWWITEGYKQYIEEKPPYKITRKQNEDKKTYHWELWTVDIMRNTIECIATRNKKEEIIQDLENSIIPMPKYVEDNKLA